MSLLHFLATEVISVYAVASYVLRASDGFRDGMTIGNEVEPPIGCSELNAGPRFAKEMRGRLNHDDTPNTTKKKD